MTRWIGIALLVLGSVEEPEFDLTGQWVTTVIECDSFSSDLPESKLAEFDGQLEYETLQGPGVRIVQMGNDLAFTDLESGRQWDGTISGDQMSYADSDQRGVGDLDFDAYLEAEGTVLEEGVIVGSYDMDWTFEVDGTAITGATLCTGRIRKELDTALPGDVDGQPPFIGTVVVNDTGLAIDQWGDDVYELGTGSDAPSLDGDILTLTLSYSGGCARHDFTLVADSQFQESDPVRLNVHLAHDAHDDPCEAYPTNRYAFDLTPVRMLYREAYGRDEGVIALRLMGPAPSARFPDLGFALPVRYEFR